MRPQAQSDVRAEDLGTAWRLTTNDGHVHEVPLLTAAVWRAADGQTELASLLAAAQRADATAEMPQVWAALDALADAGLLTARALPPAAPGLDRRTAIRTMAVAAGVALAVLPRAASSEAPAVKKAEPAKLQKEENLKVAERKHQHLMKSEQTAKAEVMQIQQKAKEEEEKLSPAIRNDPEAAKQREQSLKDRLRPNREKADEQMRKAESASEQMAKAQ